MTVIRPNSVSGITSITAQANEINFFRSNGTLAGLQLNGVNFNTTTGVSTFNNLNVGGVLTYQDVTNVDSVGIITARSGINVSGGQLDVGSNIKLGNAGIITATSVDINGGTITFGDSTGGGGDDRLVFGVGSDLNLYSDGTNVRYEGDNLHFKNAAGNQFLAKMLNGGAVELYHNNVKKFETAADRVNITGHIFITDGSRLYMSNGFGNGHATIRNEAGNTAVNMVFSTRSAGGSDTSRAMFTTDGHFIPYANNTYDLGNTATRWRNAYVNDMHFSNEGSSNSIDGTWGDWTLQEGEDKIFMINNRTGKKYSLKMEEE